VAADVTGVVLLLYVILGEMPPMVIDMPSLPACEQRIAAHRRQHPRGGGFCLAPAGPIRETRRAR
jgi:hypothetical protein